MRPTEYFFERKKWERVMLVLDGSSMLCFLSNGGRQEQHEFDFDNGEKAREEFDKAEILVMTKGFMKIDNPNKPKPQGWNPDYY
jgi:hypothetical protein